MLGKVLLFFVLTAPTIQQSCPPKYAYEASVELCFGLAADTPFTMEVNEAICAAKGGHLLKIENAFENAVLIKFLRQMFAGNNFFHLGLRKNDSSWYWTDGTPLKYHNWSWKSTRGDCAYLHYAEEYTQMNEWLAYSCHVPLLGVCQVPANPCPSDWSYFAKTEKCYYYGRNATLGEAQAYCASQNGQLASIHSDEENDLARDLITEFGTDCYESHFDSEVLDTSVILGGISFAQIYERNGTWWDNTPFDYVPQSLCNGYWVVMSTMPIIYMNGRQEFCTGCSKGNNWSQITWQNVTSTQVFPGYLCKSSPISK